ncbi:phage tail protein, partial [Carnobacterium maltaromaticum]|uniref:phage tail protein n=1 Tax=Carnobacterium maltaromaticum TaxID=2751 RepID=UPI00026C8724
MELLVKNGDYEEILIDFDYENFTENWQKNTSWTIEFRLDKTVLNEFSYDLVENEAYIIHNQQYFVVKTCEPQAEGSFVYKNIIATHICYDVQFHHVHENMTKTARIAEYMSFALGNNKLGYTYEIIGDFGTTGVEVENFGDGMDALDMLQNICSKFNAVMIADNKHFRIIAEEHWGEVTEKVFRYQYNTDNVQCSIDSTNLRTKMKLIGKTKEEDEGGGYYFAPFYIVSKNEEIIRRFGTDREQDPVSDERFIDSASIEKYGYEQLHDYYDISLSINNVGDESIEAGEQWIFIYEPLGIHEEVKIVGYKKYPYAKRKSGEAILSNENKDMISIYNQILSSTKRAEVMMANPKSFVISNMPTYVRTAIGSTLPLIVTDMEKVDTKIDDEIKQGQVDKEELEKQIQEAEKAANEYADGKAQEWEVEFEKEREEITNEINTSQALAEQAAKTYTDGKANEWDVNFAKEKGLINESITKSQAAAELAAKTYTDGKSTEWEVTFAKEKGLINESINSSEANAIATAKKYADSTTYIDSIKAKILVAESIIAEFLKVDKAMIDKLVTNSLFTTELFAQSAFVT